MTTASLIYGENFSLLSTNWGAQSEPSVSVSTSCSRSITTRCPFGSRYPASPEWSQPSFRAAEVAVVILVIALEGAVALQEDLTFVRNGNFGARQRHADRGALNVAIPVDTGDAGDLGQAVDLLEVDADGVEEFEDIRPQGETLRSAPT